MKKVTLYSYLNWYFSDENEEGFNITTQAILNINEKQFKNINILFKSCILIPKRLVLGDEGNGGDYFVEELELIR